MIRIVKNNKNPYTMINNHLLHDSNLSWKAKGILAYLLSLPDDWKVYETELVKHSRDGIDGLRSGINELIENGYIHRTRSRCDRGKFGGYEYSVYEVPNHIGFSKNGLSKNGKTKNGLSENGESNTTNTNLTNTNITNTDLTNTNNTTTTESGGSSSNGIDTDDEFKEIAQLYQSCIGQPNGLTSKWIQDHLKEHGFEWLKQALIIAEENGKRKKSYVNSILSNWKTDGGMKLGGKGNGIIGNSWSRTPGQGHEGSAGKIDYSYLTERSGQNIKPSIAADKEDDSYF